MRTCVPNLSQLPAQEKKLNIMTPAYAHVRSTIYHIIHTLLYYQKGMVEGIKLKPLSLPFTGAWKFSNCQKALVDFGAKP